eukprot:NODE_158_length_15065_cov_0.349125.p15 type:complete len:108 gc:universal NODE_158_length_15065_cov_0.349125:8129-8452(+)
MNRILIIHLIIHSHQSIFQNINACMNKFQFDILLIWFTWRIASSICTRTMTILITINEVTTMSILCIESTTACNIIDHDTIWCRFWTLWLTISTNWTRWLKCSSKCK